MAKQQMQMPPDQYMGGVTPAFTLGQVTSGGQVIMDLSGQWQPLYDRVTVTEGTTYRRLQFFALGLTGGRTIEDTNVTEGGVLSGGTVFSTQGIVFTMAPLNEDTPIADDYYQFGRGLFRLFTNASQKFAMHCGPLGAFGSVSGTTSAAAAGQVALNLGSASRVDAWMFPRPEFFIPIISEGAVKGRVTWPTAAQWTPKADYLITCYLLGQRVKTIDH